MKEVGALVIPGITTGEIWAAGLGAAVLSGATSAMVAWWVVRMTVQYDNKRARVEAAEERLSDFVEAMSPEPLIRDIGTWPENGEDFMPILIGLVAAYSQRVRRALARARIAVARVDPARSAALTELHTQFERSLLRFVEVIVENAAAQTPPLSLPETAALGDLVEHIRDELERWASRW